MPKKRKTFYKYVTAETALRILQKRTLKYSSPILFNDPFDTQTRIGLDCDKSELLEALGEEIYRLIFSEEEPAFIDTETLISRDILRIRPIVKNSKKKLSRELFNQLDAPFHKLEVALIQGMSERMNILWSKAVRASRVFCVTEVHDNLLMWAHYTRDHTGAVLEFESIPELDNPLCAAKKINYVKKAPVIGRRDEYIRYLTGQGILEHELSIYDLFLSKSEHWAYEQEWRVFIPPANMINPIVPTDVNGREILSEFLPVIPEEIHSIYLGCRMTKDHREEILCRLTGDFKHVEKYDCVKSAKEYKLEFQKII